MVLVLLCFDPLTSASVPVRTRLLRVRICIFRLIYIDETKYTGLFLTISPCPLTLRSSPTAPLLGLLFHKLCLFMPSCTSCAVSFLHPSSLSGTPSRTSSSIPGIIRGSAGGENTFLEEQLLHCRGSTLLTSSCPGVELLTALV